MAIAALFLGGTCFVLFQDIVHGAPVTAGHVLTALAIVATAAAGHSAIPTFREGRPVLGLGLLILAAAGLTYVATMSAARNAEVASTKAERIIAINAERARIMPARVRAQAMLDEAQTNLARECASGRGKRCDGIRATIEVYTAAIKGHDAELRRLGPPETPNAGYKAAAEAISLLPGLTASASEIERRLIVQMPWLAVMIAELGLIVFLSLAIEHTTVAAAKAATNDNAAPVPPRGGGHPAIPIDHPVIVALRRGPASSNDELATRLGETKGEASKKRGEVSALLVERRNGRRVEIDLRPEVRAALG